MQLLADLRKVGDVCDGRIPASDDARRSQETRPGRAGVAQLRSSGAQHIAMGSIGGLAVVAWTVRTFTSQNCKAAPELWMTLRALSPHHSRRLAGPRPLLSLESHAVCSVGSGACRLGGEKHATLDVGVCEASLHCVGVDREAGPEPLTTLHSEAIGPLHHEPARTPPTPRHCGWPHTRHDHRPVPIVETSALP